MSLEFILSVKVAGRFLYKEWGLQTILSVNVQEEEVFVKTILVSPPGQDYNYTLWAEKMRKLSLMLHFVCDSTWDIDDDSKYRALTE